MNIYMYMYIYIHTHIHTHMCWGLVPVLGSPCWGSRVGFQIQGAFRRWWSMSNVRVCWFINEYAMWFPKPMRHEFTCLPGENLERGERWWCRPPRVTVSIRELRFSTCQAHTHARTHDTTRTETNGAAKQRGRDARQPTSRARALSMQMEWSYRECRTCRLDGVSVGRLDLLFLGRFAQWDGFGRFAIFRVVKVGKVWAVF